MQDFIYLYLEMTSLSAHPTHLADRHQTLGNPIFPSVCLCCKLYLLALPYTFTRNYGLTPNSVPPCSFGNIYFSKKCPKTHQGLKRTIALSLGITMVYLLSFTTVSTCNSQSKLQSCQQAYYYPSACLFIGLLPYLFYSTYNTTLKHYFYSVVMFW